MTVALILAAFLAMAPGATREEARYVMGTLAVVKAEAADPAAGEAAVDAAFAAFATVDSLMSTWRTDSPLSRLNSAAPGWHPVDSHIHGVLSAALRLGRRSHGAFDPTVLTLMQAWGLRGENPRVPDAAELTALLARRGFNAVEVDSLTLQVYFRQANPGLDLGGIAKGYALDLAADAMAATGATAAVLDLGGNLRVFGAAAAAFPVGIVAPDDPAHILHTVSLQGGAVATSGQYERFVEIDGKPYGHILDPRTGRPVDRTGSVTVLAPSAMIADGLATALFVLGPVADSTWLTAYPEVRVIWVLPDGPGRWQIRETWPAAIDTDS